MTHVVALSGGKDSTALALRLAEVEPRAYVYLCTPTGRELPPMLEHWANLERLLGAPILRLTNGTLESWIEHHQALPNHRMRWCTRQLKIEPTIAYLLRHQPVTHYVGLRADEETREGIYGDVAALTRYPMREWGWTIRDVRRYLKERGVRIPTRTDCDWCYAQRLDEWRALARNYPDRYAQAEALEQRMGATFRSPSRDTWPASLTALRMAWARQPDLLTTDDTEGAGACRACTL